MKVKILLLLLPALFLACSNDDDASQQGDENTFTAIKNDQNWSGITEIGLTPEDTLVFLGVADGGADNGVVVATVKFEGKGSYDLKGNQGIYYETVGQDVLVSQYKIEEGKTGNFTVLSYDEQSGQIEGNFQLPLKATRLSEAKTDSTLTIIDGLFSGTIR